MDPAALRESMVDGLSHGDGSPVETDAVADALGAVPREQFLEQSADRAYLDRAFERRGSRVLAPSTVARLLEALAPEPGDDVLVVGAGVGYTAAALAEIVGARRVHAVDITRSLVLDARRNLRDAGYGAVLVDRRDGAEGLPGYGPFDRVLVEAAAVGPPATLREQLAADGRLAMPLGSSSQTLVALGVAPDGGPGADPGADTADDADRAAGSGIEAADDTPSVPDGWRLLGAFGPVRFDPLLVDGEQYGAIERNRTAREERERVARAAESRTGWEQEWIDWEGG